MTLSDKPCFILGYLAERDENVRGIRHPGLYAGGRDGWECRRCGHTFSDRTPTIARMDACQFDRTDPADV